MKINKCDRCKQEIVHENEIGTVLAVYVLSVQCGYIRPSNKLLSIAKAEDATLEYFPIEYRRDLFGEIDLCAKCFDEFMKIAPKKEKETPSFPKDGENPRSGERTL